MKIAIYGDSFATSHLPQNPNSWYRLLAGRLNADIETYAYGGTSVYWTYNNFLDNYAKYDLNIVLITDPCRYTKKSILPNIQYIPNISNLAWAKSQIENITPEQEISIRDLEGWYMMSDETFMRDMTELMIRDMKTTFLNTIVYPCFRQSFTDSRLAQMGITNEMCMYKLYEFQCNQLKIGDIEDNAMNEQLDTMCCHLGPELNKFFADVMYNGIVNGIWSFDGLETVRLQHPIDFYYKV